MFASCNDQLCSVTFERTSLSRRQTPMGAHQPPSIHDLSALRIEDRARNQGPRFRWFRWFAAALGVLLLASALIFDIKGKAVSVEVSPAHRVSGNQRVALLNASGYVTPRRRATVAAKITARVKQMYAEEGMRVQSGQVLAMLDDSDAQVRLASAKADRELRPQPWTILKCSWPMLSGSYTVPKNYRKAA